MISCNPESLFMFLRLLFGGQGLLEVDHDDGAAQKKKKKMTLKVRFLVLLKT